MKMRASVRLSRRRLSRLASGAKQADVARETLDIYAPLANRLGMQQVRLRMVEETRYRWVDREVRNFETRTRLDCCRPETRVVTTSETVTVTESAVPDAACTAAGYALSAALVCEHPAGVDLGDVSYECDSGWAAAAGDPTSCERAVTEEPDWDCPDAPAYTLDTSTTPPHCHLVGPCPPAALGALGAGVTTRTGSWDDSCRSGRLGGAQSPHWARSWTFSLDAAATVAVSQAGVYTIEATTFYRHRDSRPRRTTGAYTLTVSVDHRQLVLP